MTTPEEIARIAKGLTKAQREAVIGSREAPAILYGDGVFRINAGGATVALCKKGIIRDREFRGLTGRSARGYALTPLGLALRTYLMENPQ